MMESHRTLEGTVANPAWFLWNAEKRESPVAPLFTTIGKRGLPK